MGADHGRIGRHLHQAAPDRPRDLHPLQHLRGDLPGQCDHARLAQLRRRRRASATCAWPASRRAPRAASTTGGPCRRRRPTRSRSSSAGSRLPEELSEAELAEAAGSAEAAAIAAAGGGAVAAASSRRDGVPQRATTAPRCRRGRPRMPTPTCTARRRPSKTIDRDRDGQCARDRGRQGVRHAPHRARLRRHAVPGAGGAEHRHRAAGRSTRGAGRTIPRQYCDRQRRATASGPGYNNISLTIKRVLEDHEGQPGARRGQQLHVRPEGGRQGAGDRPLRRELPDAEPSEEPHRHDLHRHRQRADARDDGMAPAPAHSPASSRAAS